jgi:hypothetical protein
VQDLDREGLTQQALERGRGLNFDCRSTKTGARQRGCSGRVHQEKPMSVFMAQRSLKGIPMEQLAAAQQRAIRTADEMSRQGEPIRYLRSAYVPETGQCNCLFEAQGAQQVEKLNRTAGIPYDRIVEAMDLTPEPQAVA